MHFVQHSLSLNLWLSFGEMQVSVYHCSAFTWFPSKPCLNFAYDFLIGVLSVPMQCNLRRLNIWKSDGARSASQVLRPVMCLVCHVKRGCCWSLYEDKHVEIVSFFPSNSGYKLASLLFNQQAMCQSKSFLQNPRRLKAYPCWPRPWLELFFWEFMWLHSHSLRLFWIRNHQLCNIQATLDKWSFSVLCH